MKSPTSFEFHLPQAGLLRAAVVLLAGLAVAPAAYAQGTVQNLIYLPSNGHWYGRVDARGMSWPAASIQASTFAHNGVDGYLMRPGSQVECDLIRWSLGTTGDNLYWIGAFQVGGPEPVGTWRWQSFEPWDFTSWAPGRPNNNSAPLGMTCTDESVAAAWGYSGIWEDVCPTGSGFYWDYFVAGYVIEFPSADIIITPGESDTASFTIESNGVVPPAFTMQVESPAGTWLDLSGTPTPLSGGGTAAVNMPTPMSAVVVFDGASGDFQVRAKGTNSFETVYSNLETVTVGGPTCDSIDFNGDGFFPDTADIDDYLSVFSGGPCSTGTCGDTDFNNDGLYPDTMDIDALLSVFSGGPCL